MIVMVIEEAQRVFSQRAESNCSEGASYFSTMASLERGAGVKMLVNVQTTDDLTRSIIANSSVKVMGRLGDHQDYERMGRSMGMNPEQIEFCKKRLRAGVYAVKVADIGDPFIIKTPFLDLANTVSDEEAWASGEALRHELMSATSSPSVVASPMAPPDPEAVLSADEKAYLQAVRDNPNRPSAEYARLTAFSNRKAAAVRKALVEKKFLREWRVEVTARGARAIILELLSGPDQPEAHPGRKGNFITQFARLHIDKRLASEGYDDEFEKGFPVGDRTDYLDIYGVHRQTGVTVGVEIETDAKRGINNLRMALEVRLDRVIIVGCTRNVRNAIEEQARKEFSAERLTNISFSTLSDYLEESYD